MKAEGRLPWGALGRTLSVICLAALSQACASPPASERHALIGQMLESSVQLFTERDGGGRRAGSAVILSLDDDGSTLLTTAHTLVPQVEQSLFIVAPPGKTRVGAEILAIDEERDLALLKTSLSTGQATDLSDGAYLVDPVWVAAFPWGRERTVINGAVSQIHERDDTSGAAAIYGPVRMIDASVSYGMSGGGVYDSESGDLIGLVRGYRTAHLSLDSSSAPLKLPVAGETTVVSTHDIACFLETEGRQDLMPERLKTTLEAWPCT
ncbi:MAG: serine protease [Pseudomonadota bacterium]